MFDSELDAVAMAAYATGERYYLKSSGLEIKSRPGVLLGRYPQKKETRNTGFEKLAARWSANIKFLLNRPKYTQSYIVSRVNYYEHDLKQ